MSLSKGGYLSSLALFHVSFFVFNSFAFNSVSCLFPSLFLGGQGDTIEVEVSLGQTGVTSWRMSLSKGGYLSSLALFHVSFFICFLLNSLSFYSVLCLFPSIFLRGQGDTIEAEVLLGQTGFFLANVPK